ncbi:3',5'-nucleoside bisphosphate phosphatase [Candidatus Magnetomoraceae bacterium gMMP-15]
MIDLHIHSTASDGSLTPREILALACKLKLRAIAITDHDTINGSKEALKAGIPCKLEFINGVEISTQLPDNFSVSSFHMLGYFIDLDNPKLNKNLNILQEARDNRTPMMLEKLNKAGVDISLDEVKQAVGDSQTGRPHIAKIIVKKGFASNIQQAFDKYIGSEGACYVEKYRLKAKKAIEIITGAGGIPVLAHPYLIKTRSIDELEELIIYLKSAGLKGLEVFYSEHTPKLIDLYQKLARKYDLIMTGGTDFHGSFKPGIQMGIGKGNLKIPYSLYKTMLKRHNELGLSNI